MELNTGLKKEERAAVSGGLSKLLSNLYLLYVKTQHVHWNLHGLGFYALHKMTQEHYEAMAEEVDEVAERIRALGFFVEGTLKSFLEHGSIKEDGEIKSEKKYLEDLLQDHEVVIRDLRGVGALAAEQQDHGTSDMIGRLTFAHEKMAWILRASL